MRVRDEDVILEDGLFRALPPPCESEQDMLDLACGVTDTFASLTPNAHLMLNAFSFA